VQTVPPPTGNASFPQPVDVSSDGKRFLINTLPADERPASINVVMNRTAG